MVVKAFEEIGKVPSFEEIGAVPSFEEIEPQKKTGLIGEALLSVEPDAEDIEKYQRMGVKEYRSPAGELYDLTEPSPRTKGSGYFGELKLPTGGVATEYSVGVRLEGLGGKETDIPSLVPTLTKEEIDLMVNDIIPNRKKVPDEIVQKAVDHANKRVAEGKSPFAQAPAKPIGLLERGAKGFGRSFTNVLKAIETKSRVVGGIGQQLETYDLVQQFRDKTGRAPSADEFLQISKQAQVNIEAESAERYKALDVPPPETIPEKATEIGAGLAGFITKLTLTKKALGVPRGSLGGDVAAWEALNLAEGGTPGTGAAFRLMLAATGKIPAVTKAAKAGRVGVESGLFAGLSALRGDDPEVIAMHALIPIAFQAYATTKGRISDAQMVKSWRQRLPFMRDVPVTSSLKMARASRALYEIRNPKLSPKMRQKLAVQWEKRFGTSVDEFLKEMDVAFKAAGPPVPEQIEGRIQPPTAVKPTEAPRVAVKPPVTPVAAITPTKPTPTAPKIAPQELAKEAEKIRKVVVEKKQPLLDEIGAEFASQIEGSEYKGTPKSVRSIISKVTRYEVKRPGYGPHAMSDHARGVVILKDWKDAPALIKLMQEKGFSGELLIDNPLNALGYRGIKGTVSLGDEINAEIQIHTASSWKLKNQSDPLYREIRDVTDVKDLSPKQKASYAAKAEQMNKMWVDYWDKVPSATKLSISASVKGIDSWTSIPEIPSAGVQRPLSKISQLEPSIRKRRPSGKREIPISETIAKKEAEVKGKVKKWDLHDWMVARNKELREAEKIKSPQERIEAVNAIDEKYAGIKKKIPGSKDWITSEQYSAQIRVKAKRELAAKPAAAPEIAAEKPVAPRAGTARSAVREPWELTKKEYVESKPLKGLPRKLEYHRPEVQLAIKQGKPVPPEVLSEYKGEKWADEALAKLEKLAKRMMKPAPVAEPEAIAEGEVEVGAELGTESPAFNKHLDYFQSKQLPETSKIRDIQKAIRVVNGKRLAGKITPQQANKQIAQLRKQLYQVAQKEGVSVRMTKGGKVLLAVRKAGTYAPEEFSQYGKFKNVYPLGQDITRSVQQIDGALPVKEKVKMKGQAGAVERYVLWPTREMSKQKLEYIKEKSAHLKRIFKTKRGTKEDAQINLVLEKIAKADRSQPIKNILSAKTIKAMAVKPSVVKQAVELRKFYDDSIEEQNQARKMRNQDPIPYRRNYSPHILRDATIWERVMMKGIKEPRTIFGDKTPLPDYIKPNKPFNPREMAREAGIPYDKRVRSAVELAQSYLVTAAKDIFNTSIIQSNKAFIQQLETMGNKNAANFLADWTAEAYAGIAPAFDRGIKLTQVPKAKRGMQKFNRIRNLAVFPFNFSWNLLTQTSSLALTVGRYGTVNTAKGFYQWLHPNIRKQAAEDYYSYIVKTAKQGRITHQDAQNLIGETVKLRRTTTELARDISTYFLEQLEKLLTGTSIRAAHLHGAKRGLTGESLKNYASDGGAKTQSMYNDEDKPALLRSVMVKTGAPYQTFAYEVMNTLREWAGRTGTPPDTKLYTVWTVLRFLAAATVFAAIAKKGANKDVWSWKRPPIPFAEFWLTPIIRIFSKEYMGGSASGLTSPVETTRRIAKGIDDVLETNNWRKLRNELIKYGPSVFRIPGGVQWSRTVDAIIAYSQGGVRDRRGRLLFKMEDPQDLVQGIFSGVWTTKGGREYLERRTGKKAGQQTRIKRQTRQKREKRMLRK